MNRSILIALGIFCLLVVYMLTGLIGCSRASEELAPEASPAEEARMTVEVEELAPEMISREVVLTGKTVPSRSVLLKSETAGQVEWVAELRGRPVSSGEELAILAMDDREDRLEQALALRDQSQLEFEAALRLKEQGLRSDSQMAQARAQLRGAEQAVRTLELEVERTRIVAPFDAFLEERFVEVGDYLAIGDPVADIIDLDPLVVEAQATEFQVELLKPGEIGHARLSDGREMDGIIRYVAGQADPMARTFLVELEIPNEGGRLPAGLTVEMAVETERVAAYRISPAFISVSDDGRFGVKYVDAEGRVGFTEADIVKTEPDALWLTGLPDPLRLITIGHGFTQPGDTVNYRISENGW